MTERRIDDDAQLGTPLQHRGGGNGAAVDHVTAELAWARERPNRLTEGLYVLGKLVWLSPEHFQQVESMVDALLASDPDDG